MIYAFPKRDAITLKDYKVYPRIEATPWGPMLVVWDSEGMHIASYIKEYTGPISRSRGERFAVIDNVPDNCGDLTKDWFSGRTFTDDEGRMHTYPVDKSEYKLMFNPANKMKFKDYTPEAEIIDGIKSYRETYGEWPSVPQLRKHIDEKIDPLNNGLDILEKQGAVIIERITESKLSKRPIRICKLPDDEELDYAELMGTGKISYKP